MSANPLTPDTPGRLDGAALITAERQRQIDSEGWTPAHDDAYRHFELVRAAIVYADVDANLGPGLAVDLASMWPWAQEWLKPSDDPVRNLVKAGALIAAEIDRLQRKQEAR